MKNSVRLFSAILAAMLCAAAFSACAGNVKPPVTDAPAITTDVPTTDAPLVTTDTAVTTEPPVTTTAPATTEAVVTTETPDTDAPAIDSAASDFEYSANGNGGITITKYIRTDREQRVTDVTIPKEIDGKTVTAIGEAAFRYVSWMESLTMPDTVTHIGKAAFEKCLGLKTVALSSSLTDIGSLAFSECTALSDVTLPDSLTTIGASAFRECTSLKSIVIPGKCFTVPSSDGECFYGSGVEHVEFKAGVKYIPAGMFWTSSVKTVILPDGIVEIGRSAFSGCSGITEVKPGKDLITIGDFAFAGASITSITIPETVKNVTEAAFEGCMKLQKVTFLGDAPEGYETSLQPASGKNLNYTVYYSDASKGFAYPVWGSFKAQPIDGKTGISVFSDFEYYENEEKGITVYSYLGNATEATVPESISGKPVTRIGRYAFYLNDSVEKVTLPDTVTVIGEGAFSRCAALNYIVFSNAITTIGEKAFYNCDRLVSVTLPDKLTEIGAHAFSGSSGLRMVTIPDGTRVIGEGAFSYTGLTCVVFGEGLERIESSAFSNCKLTTVVLPESLRYIGRLAFAENSELMTVKLNEGLEKIEYMAFYGVSKLTEIIIPQTVTGVQDIAFSGCSGLRTVYFMGDAPASFVGTEKAANTSFTVYYTAEADGFTSPEWCGYETRVFDIADLYPEYPDELKEPFLSVVKGEKSFRYGNYNSYVTQFSEKISKVAIVDLDGDGKDEVVVRLQSQLIILRDTADGVIGLVCRHQAMNDINKDGTFYWNANAGLVYGCSSLTFTESTYTTTEHYRVEQGENGEVKYYVAGVKASETEYNAAAAKIAKDSVVWLDIAE